MTAKPTSYSKAVVGVRLLPGGDMLLLHADGSRSLGVVIYDPPEPYPWYEEVSDFWQPELPMGF